MNDPYDICVNDWINIKHETILSEPTIEKLLYELYENHITYLNKFHISNDWSLKPGYLPSLFDHEYDERIIKLLLDDYVVFTGTRSGGLSYPDKPAIWCDDLSCDDKLFISNLLKETYATRISPKYLKEKEEWERHCEQLILKHKQEVSVFRRKLDEAQGKHQSYTYTEEPMSLFERFLYGYIHH